MSLSHDRFVSRHVLPVGVTPPTDQDGFLTLGRSWITNNPSRHPIPLEELVGSSRSFALLGSDGAGKSRALQHLRARFEPHSKWVKLVGASIDRMSDALEHAASSASPVYVDAIDVALHHEPALADVLADLLNDAGRGHVAWRLACRPASWNLQLASAFSAHTKMQAQPQFERWPAPSQYTLLPLTRHGAARVAEDAGASSTPFLDALVSSRMGRFAGHPGRLSIIATVWADDGHLPSGHVAVLEREIAILLSETGVGRHPGRLSASRKLKIAERLGAFAMFGGITRFSTEDHFDEQVTALNALPHDPEPTEIGIEYSPAHYQEVTSSALFQAALDGTLSFPHQQYPEFLAARYLTQRNASPAQIRSILGVSETGALPSGMNGVAAWIAALKPELVWDMVLDNATALLASRVDLPSEELRSDIVERVLDDAANSDIDLLHGESFANLAHRGLSEQLLSKLDAGVVTGNQLWWISRLARDGNCREACDDILAATLSSRWPDWARVAGVHTIGMIGTDPQQRDLRALLHLPEDEDADDNLLAGAIEATYPRHLTTRELLRALRPRRNRDLSGYYIAVLRDLPGQIPAADLKDVINWACTSSGKHDREMGSFIPQLVATAWTAPSAVGLMAEIARLVAAIAEHPPWGSGLGEIQPPWHRLEETDRRREMLLAVLDQLGDGRSYLIEGTGLLTDDDQLWALGALPAITGPARTFLAHWIADCGCPSVPLIDAVLSLPPEHPLYDLTSWWRGPFPIDSPLAQRYRDTLARRNQRSHQVEAGIRRQKAALHAAVTAATADVDQWWRILVPLSNPDTRGDVLANDLTNQEGWAWLTAEQQDLVIELGWQYLATHEPTPERWAGLESFSGYERFLPDWSAVCLLTTIAGRQPDRLDDIGDDIWARWAPAIIGAWDAAAHEDRDLRIELLERFPTEVLPSLATAFFGYLDLRQAAGIDLLYDSPVDWAIAATAGGLRTHLLDGRYTGKLAVALLNRLVAQDRAQAIAASCEILGRTNSELELPALRILAEHAPWKLIGALEARNWSQEALTGCISRLDVRKLQPEDLEAITSELVQRFPMHESAVWETGWVDEDAANQVRIVRDRALQRLADLGRTDYLHRLSTRLAEPEIGRFKALLRRAMVNAADRKARLVRPQELIHLLERADARLIRDEGDLVAALLDQLRVIQHELQTTGLFRDIWNDCSPAPTPKVEDSISDWLERQLDLRFQQPIFIEREPQVVRKKERGTGTRIDLKLSASTLTRPPQGARVILEAKRLDNSSLRQAMDRQLRQQYLLPEGVRHGIFVVYWIRASQRPSSWRVPVGDRQDLLFELQRQADSLPDVTIKPLVLDISRPEP